MVVGDAEMDEGNIFECLQEGWKHDLRNTWWIIDYNRQSLDGVVQEGLALLEARCSEAGVEVHRRLDESMPVIQADYGDLLAQHAEQVHRRAGAVDPPLRRDHAADLATARVVVVGQVEQLIEARPRRRWLLGTSPRTPASLARRLAGRPEFDYVPFAASGRGWLAQRMAEAGEIWVSEDSVSMLYEALSSGARVGALKVQRGAANRVTAAVDSLVERGWLGRPGDWQPGTGPEGPFNEAGRCAAWVRQQWLSAH